MKKALIPLMVLALSGAAIHAQESQSVTSVNAVGMVNVEIPASGLAFVGLSFLTSGTTLDAVIGDQLNGGMSPVASDNIFVWDPVQLRYRNFWKAEGLGESLDGRWYITGTITPADIELQPGSGFWVQNRSSEVQILTLSGEVPSDSINVNIYPNLTQITFPFPVEMDLNDPNFSLTEIATGGQSTGASDTIIVWNQETQSYRTFWLADNLSPSLDGQWYILNSITPADVILQPGQGFWVNFRNSTQLQEWVATKPYLWP
jgi:hypothetical protein